MNSATQVEPLVQLCAFRVGDHEYAIDLMRVREIIQPLPITPVPRAPEYVEGVINLRGQIIPLVDVRKRFGIGDQPASRQTRFLIVNLAGRVLALVVDAVLEVMRIPRSVIRPTPALAGAGGSRLFLGVCGGGSDRPSRLGDPARMPPPRGGRRWTPPVAHGNARASAQLRLLLNVKALLEPSLVGEMAAARELTGPGESP